MKFRDELLTDILDGIGFVLCLAVCFYALWWMV